jgi:hypothetical protein
MVYKIWPGVTPEKFSNLFATISLVVFFGSLFYYGFLANDFPSFSTANWICGTVIATGVFSTLVTIGEKNKNEVFSATFLPVIICLFYFFMR